MSAIDLEHAALPGVLPFQSLVDAVAKEWIRASGIYRIDLEDIQPASIDLRLGTEAWPLQCSFVSGRGSSVEEKVRDLADQPPIDLTKGAILERDRPYLIPLIEELQLPKWLRAKANPKSSTGRLDVFTRVITDSNHRFDDIAEGYDGRLYLEVVPRSFPIKVITGLALNQLRLVVGDAARCSDDEIRAIHKKTPLLYIDGHPAPEPLILADGLFLSVDISGDADRIIGYRAKETTPHIDLTGSRRYAWEDFWEPLHPGKKSRIVLAQERFYLLLSTEGVCIPPDFAAEMLAYDPTAGELRTHYAGFFDPGFGYEPARKVFGSRAALEVRARDVPFMVEDGQPISKLAFERLTEPPQVLYGGDVGSNYQGQMVMLSKHFTEQTAGVQQMKIRDLAAARETLSQPR